MLHASIYFLFAAVVYYYLLSVTWEHKLLFDTIMEIVLGITSISCWLNGIISAYLSIIIIMQELEVDFHDEDIKKDIFDD